jgi:hypothetical protein
MVNTSVPLREDLLTGCAAIAEYLGWNERRVYYVADKGYLPIKRIGNILTARKSELDKSLTAAA